jgi:hypothetical protein
MHKGKNENYKRIQKQKKKQQQQQDQQKKATNLNISNLLKTHYFLILLF